jgi:integrase
LSAYVYVGSGHVKTGSARYVIVTLPETMSEQRSKRLTVKLIENLKPASKPYEIPDGGGLYLTVRPNGSKSFNLRYRFCGKARNLTLGLSAVGLATARELAREALVELARGNDPGAAKQERKAALRIAANESGDLVETIVEEFIEAHVKRNLKPSTRREVGRLLRKETASWRGRSIGDIGPQDIHRLLDAVIARGATVAANRIFAALRRMFRWAKERRIISSSPCDDIRAPTSERGRARERALDDGELRLTWKAAETLGLPFGPMVQLLILTGQRRAEVAGMRWNELDLNAGIWTIPPARSKNHRQHEVPLAPGAAEILRSLPRFEGSEFVLSAGNTPPSGFSRGKARLDYAIARLNEGEPILPWIIHDIRRSVASSLARLGINLPVIEKVLNHVSGSFGGIAGVYQRHGFEAEKRHALDSWARHVEALVTGETCVNVMMTRHDTLAHGGE